MHENLKKCLLEFFKDNKNEKVLFIGAGFSKNLGLPTWEEFAYKHLDVLRDAKEMNFETAELLKKENFRTIISFAIHHINKKDSLKKLLHKKYKEIFKIDLTQENFNLISKTEFNSFKTIEEFINSGHIETIKKHESKLKKLQNVKQEDGLFKTLYDLKLINVTTNYDDILDILASNDTAFDTTISKNDFKKYKKSFYSKNDFENLNRKDIKGGQVFHIHGSIDGIDTMIVSNEDYIKRYWNGTNCYKDFLKIIFEQYNILFLGYSLQELEILNYLFEGEKSIVNKTNKKRILILDSYDYEKEKTKFLSAYYKDNYNIDLCCYSKSENGYKEITNVVNLIKKIKSNVEEKKDYYKKCIALIEKEDLNSDEKNTLLSKLKLYNYDDLQSCFFNKILEEKEWYSLISEHLYFQCENINVKALLRYVNSIYLNSDSIKEKDLNSLYNYILSCTNTDIELVDLLGEFVVKYSSKISLFNLDYLITKNFHQSFNTYLILNLFVKNMDNTFTFKFLKVNNIKVLELIAKQLFKSNHIYYTLLSNENFKEYLLSENGEKITNIIIKEYEKKSVKNNVKNNDFELILNKDKLKISKGTNNKVIDFDNLNLETLYEKLEINCTEMGLNFNHCKELLKSLLSNNSYSSIFDDKYLIKENKFDFLLKIFQLSNIKDYLINKLFMSKIYILKKLSLYIIIENNMVDYLIEKINNNSFDLEYMIRNCEFAGEIKKVFQLLNNYNKLEDIKAENILTMIKKGEFIAYENVDEERKCRWTYIRIKELINFQIFKDEFDILKSKVQYDYELSPLIGPITIEDIKIKASISFDIAMSMNLQAWINHMNNFEEEKSMTPSSLIEYSKSEDVKLFIECLKQNVNLFMKNINLLINIEDYEWYFYIFNELNDLIEDDKNDFSNYYKNILDLISLYLDKLTNIYEELEKFNISKKYLIKKICSIFSTILLSSKHINNEIYTIFKEIIDKLEVKVSNTDDFKKILISKTSYINFLYNSVHKYLLDLEINLCFKIKDSVTEKIYINNLLENRKENSPKEFFMTLGEKLYTFLAIDTELTENIIKNIKDEDKEMFLSGFSYCRTINQKDFNLIKHIIEPFYNKRLSDSSVRANIIEYCILSFLLGYENNTLNIIKHKDNLDRNSIFRIFMLKETCKKLNQKYNEEKYCLKIIEIWKTILELHWNETENDWDLLEATIEATRNFDYIDDDIKKILVKLIECIPSNYGFEYKLCEYLKSICTLKNIDSIIEVMKNYKSNDYNSDFIDLCEYIKTLNNDRFKELKEYLLTNSKINTSLQEKLLKMK